MRINSIAIQDNKMWYLPNDYALLMRHDFETKESTVMVQFPKCEFNDASMYSALVAYGKEIIIAPGKAEDFLLYNIETQKITSVDSVPEQYVEDSIRSVPKFGDAFLVQAGKACFIGHGLVGIAIYDFGLHRLEYFPMKCDITHKISRIFARNTVWDEDVIYLPFHNGNQIAKFNLNSGRYSFEELEENGYVGTCMVEGRQWILPRYGRNMTIVDWKSEQAEAFEITAEHLGGDYEMAFLGMVYSNGFVYVFPMKSDMILKINPTSYEVTELYKVERMHDQMQYLYVFSLDDHTIMAYSRDRDVLDIIDTKTEEYYQLEIRIANKEAFLKGIIKEGRPLSLTEFVNCIVER